MLKKSAQIICSRLEYTVVGTCLIHACQHRSKLLTVRLMSLCQPYTEHKRAHDACQRAGKLVDICLLGQYARLRIGVLRIGVTEQTLFVRFAPKKQRLASIKTPKVRARPAAAI